METSVLAANDLPQELIRSWRDLLQRNPALRSPFFCPEFTQAVASVRPDVRVGVVRDAAGEVQAIFPFHVGVRGAATPIGYPFSDCHGVIASPHVSLDPPRLIRQCGLRSFDFCYLPAAQTSFQPFFEAWEEVPVLELSRFNHHGTSEQRRLRKLERRLGPTRFEPHVGDTETLATLIEWKRFHCFRTGFVDLLEDDWIRELLHVLLHTKTDHFAGRLSVLYAGDRMVAAHMGLRSKHVWHGWFPSYDPDAARNSPGRLMFFLLFRHAKETGLDQFDFGAGQTDFKERYANSTIPVGQGFVSLSPLDRTVRNSRIIARRAILRSPLERPLRTALRWLKT